MVCIDLQSTADFDPADQNQDLQWLPEIKSRVPPPRAHSGAGG